MKLLLNVTVLIQNTKGGVPCLTCPSELMRAAGNTFSSHSVIFQSKRAAYEETYHIFSSGEANVFLGESPEAGAAVCKLVKFTEHETFLILTLHLATEAKSDMFAAHC